jgi:AsmA protein
MLRKILIGTAVVLGLVVLALVALVLLVDVNRFKPQIQQAVKERTNRTLAIRGDLSLKVLPRIAVALPRTALSEPGSDKPFATLESARVSVALLPLLGGRVEAGKISVDGLSATIERRADGSTNIDDLLRAQESAQDRGAAPAEAKKDSKPGGPPQFEIGGVELTNANLTLRDLASKNTIALKQLNLEVGRIATVSRSPLNLTTQFSSTAPALAGSLEARGEIDLDLVKQAYGAQGLSATLKGSLDKQPLEAALKADRLAIAGTTLQLGGVALTARGTHSGSSFEAQLNAPDVQVSETEARGQRLSAAVKLTGAQTANLQLALEGLSGNAKDLKIGKLALTGTTEQRVAPDRLRRIVANLASPATASLEAQTLALPQLNGEVTIEDPALPNKSARMPVTASIALDAKKELLDARLASKFDETALNIAAGVRGFSPLRVNFTANADRLNVDRYFPPAPAAATPAAAPAKGAGGTPTEDAAVDLSALKGLNLNGEVNVGQLQARGIKTQNLRAVLKAANGRLDVAPLTAALYGGTLNANASAQAEGNRIASSIALTGISIQPLMKDALNKDLLEGRGNVKLDITTGGATVNGLKKALDGNGAIMLRDGAFKGINIGAKLRQAQALFGRGGTETQQTSANEKTDFTELSASFSINNGIATSNDLDVKSPLLRIGGAGQVDIPAGTLDYTVRAMVVNTSTGQEGKELTQLRGVTIPVKLSGPFDKLSYSIDWSSAAQEALKSRAAEQLKDKVAPQLDEKKKKLEQRARDALKGLLGR